jgi:predicted regulator of Ras-like GTPase activity (Roadblock/LC7/MglB family)
MSEQPLDAGGPTPLPVRRQSPARRGFPPTAPVLVQAPYDADTLTRSLREIHGVVDRISGLLVATRDGLVISGDTRGIENDSVAAMAAAAIGLTAQFTNQAKVGEPRAAMFEGVSGYVCVFPVEETILLVVFGEPDITMGLFNIAAKQALSLLQQAILRNRVHSFRATRRACFEDPAEEGFGSFGTQI